MWNNDNFAKKLTGRKVIMICEGQAWHLTSADGNTTLREPIEEHKSNQEESDSRVILYCKYALEQKNQVVKIRSPDSEIFCITLHHALNFKIRIPLDNGPRLIDMKKLAHDYTQKQCTAQVERHTFSKCDTTKAFKHKGKVTPIKLLNKCPRLVCLWMPW